MKYSVGDRVKIKSLDWYNENKDEDGNIELPTHIFISEMSQFCGKVVTIEDVFEGVDDNEVYYMEEIDCGWTDEMIEGLVEEESKSGSALNPIEPKSNANCLTRERVDALATKFDEELPSGNQNVWELPDGYQFVDENGNIINAQKIVLEKKKKEYPKTYEECCKVLGYGDIETYCFFHNGADKGLFEALYRLKVCRDAYWKIAGEEMGLGKPWETSKDKMVYSFYRHSNEIETDIFSGESVTFEFPTKEMRDAFYENFKELIEQCKELL